MSLRAALLALAALAAPGLASAEERDLSAMMNEARACLAHVNAHRGTLLFVQRNMAELARKLASDIDYAEAWSRHDLATAARYLSSAMDCESTVTAWIDSRTETGAPLRKDQSKRDNVYLAVDDSPAAPDLSFLITGRARRGLSYNKYVGPELAAWDNPYGR